MTRAGAYLVLLVAQAMCAVLFSSDILLSVTGYYPGPLSWTTREFLEVGALVGLLLGLAFGSALVWRAFGDLRRAEARLERASGAFNDVALFAIKGLTLQDIARLRETSEGTVKAQTAAIYRKAQVSGRPQLLSLFIEDLMGTDREDLGQPGEKVRRFAPQAD